MAVQAVEADLTVLAEELLVKDSVVVLLVLTLEAEEEELEKLVIVSHRVMQQEEMV